LFEYDKIVVGSSLEAMLFAFNNEYPIIFAEERRPFRFDHLEPELDLSCIGIGREDTTLTSREGNKIVGTKKETLWEHMIFLMSLNGQVPLSNMAHSIRHTGDTINCANEYNRIAEITFNECFYFGDNKSTGFVHQKALDNKRYICYDNIAFHIGGKHELDYIQTEDNLVGEVWFYGSDRIDGNTPIKDAIAVSFLDSKQLLDFEYSETMARFKLIYEMEQRGLKGKKASEQTTAGNDKYYKHRTSSIYRQTRECPIRQEPQASNITLPKVSEENLLEGLSAGCLGYNRFLKYLVDPDASKSTCSGDNSRSQP
tara:strand:+ start:32756 stop:33694 length:939 start_codon:yes stop_codon:yes gene_type:complete